MSVIYCSASHNNVEFDLFLSSPQWTNPGRTTKQILIQKIFFLPRKVFLYLTKKNVLPKKFSSYQKASKKHFFVAPLLNQPGTTKEISRGEKIYYTCLKPIFRQKINFCYLAHSKKIFFFLVTV